MNDLTIFNSNEFGEIRTVTIDGKPYFVATDVATALGYQCFYDFAGSAGQCKSL